MRMTEKEFERLCASGKCRVRSQTSAKTAKKITDIQKTNSTPLQFDSYAEKMFYFLYIIPRIQQGEILKCEAHRSFVILDAIPQYNLSQKVYTPDFVLHGVDGKVTVVEMKGKKIKQLQRDYGLRKQLFIEKYCVPNGWIFREECSEQWTNQKGVNTT